MPEPSSWPALLTNPIAWSRTAHLCTNQDLTPGPPRHGTEPDSPHALFPHHPTGPTHFFVPKPFPLPRNASRPPTSTSLMHPTWRCLRPLFFRLRGSCQGWPTLQGGKGWLVTSWRRGGSVKPLLFQTSPHARGAGGLKDTVGVCHLRK